MRADSHGGRYARRRYYGDVLSLWRRSTDDRRDRSSELSPDASEPACLGEVARDLTYAVRLLRRSPGVVAVTVLGLGLAIGVSTSVFSL